MILASEETIQLLLSLLIGGVIGLEREYSSKAAGFRTLILISVGSTMFTIISKKLGGPENSDRIAANIITGIGFIGAGVVFKDGFNVTGLTTAASIWVTAALGMSVGTGDYMLAIEGTAIALAVLFLFERLQKIIDDLHQKRTYKIVVHQDDLEKIHHQLEVFKIGFTKRSETRKNDEIHISLDIGGNKQQLLDFNNYLLNAAIVKSFDC